MITGFHSLNICNMLIDNVLLDFLGECGILIGKRNNIIYGY